MKEKRSRIDADRIAEIQRPGSVYTITCGINGCPCDLQYDGCGRGFFSLFIQAVYGIDFSRRNNIPYHVDFGNVKYRYADPASSDKNFWNYFFDQPLKIVDKESSRIINRFIELYPLKIWSRGHFQAMNENIINHLVFTGQLHKKLEAVSKKFEAKKILGVHIRTTDHSDEVPPISLKKYIKTICRDIHQFSALFVATDDLNVLNKLQEVFGNKVIYNDTVRSTDNLPVHLNDTIKDGAGLGHEVFSDCYCLSLCSKVIICHSNVSYAALLFNPALPYTLLEPTKAKVKRYKTLFLYHLDRLGIRKW